jgi:hypothetical protein
VSIEKGGDGFVIDQSARLHICQTPLYGSAVFVTQLVDAYVLSLNLIE